jgi:hypothetical protein
VERRLSAAATSQSPSAERPATRASAIINTSTVRPPVPRSFLVANRSFIQAASPAPQRFTVIDNGTLTYAEYYYGAAITDTLSASLVGSGAVVVSSGADLVLSGTASGFGGTFTIANGGTLEVANIAALGSGAVSFAGANAVLKIDGTAMPTNARKNMGYGDSVDLAGVAYSSGGSGQIVSGNTGVRLICE